jgi:hypothetical protein
MRQGVVEQMLQLEEVGSRKGLAGFWEPLGVRVKQVYS